MGRWERSKLQLTGTTLACLKLLLDDPERALLVLSETTGFASDGDGGFAGDGGPPPARGGHNGPLVDEFGFTDVEGPAPEPDPGWEQDDEIGTAEFSLEFDTADDLEETGDFFTPGFDGAGGGGGEDQE